MSSDDSISPVIYKAIQGYPGYRVGSDGSVWTSRIPGKYSRIGTEWRAMKIVNVGRYCGVGLTDPNGQRKMMKVHRLVLTAFRGPCPQGHQACHYPERDPSNNRLSNLRWGTPSENNGHKVQQGTHQVGSKNPRAKLSESDVLRIREQLKCGRSPQQIAKEYRVTDTLIRLIRDRKCWQSI